MSMDPTLTRIVTTLGDHPTMPIPATIDHTGGGIFCVRVDVDRTSDVGEHDGPFLYLTDGAEMGQPGTVAVGVYRTWEDDGGWPVDGDWDSWPRALRCVPWADVHATVLEGAELLSTERSS